MTDRTFRIRAFAALTGVTVRTLHHYDRIGLLTPRRGANNYRVYDKSHLPRLESIVALKFIGLSLETIGSLLQGRDPDLAAALRTQRVLLERKRQLLDQVIVVIAEAEGRLRTQGGLDGSVFRHIIEVIEMQNNSEAWQKQYDALVDGKLQQLRAMSPETRSALAAAWATLVKDIEGALDQDPASAGAQALGARWLELLRAFVPANAELDPALLKTHGAASRPAADAPSGMASHTPAMGDPRVWAFMQRVLAARG